ncbi:MAG: MFS transporter [Deltaproteobacteria bacterium]|nr:MFS transporter [Deltaproteobacteria bacterium]
MPNPSVNHLPQKTSRFFYGYTVAGAALLIMLMMFATRYVFGVFFKPTLSEFGWTRAMTSGAFSLSMFMEGLLGILMGMLTDRFGPRAVLTLCGFFLGIGCLLMSRVNALWQFYLFFGVIMGIGISGGWVPLLTTIARWFVKKRGLMSGIVLTGTSLGAVIAPPVGEWLISAYNWRTSYTIMGIVVFALIVFSAQLLRRDPYEMGQRPDGGVKGRVPDSSTVIAGVAFRDAFSTRQFWSILIMYWCFGFCFFTVMVHIVPHSTDLGIASAAAARILATIGGLTCFGRIFLGKAADRIGARWIFIIGFILFTATFFWMVQADQIWMIYFFAIPFGFLQGGMGASESPLVADIFGLRSHGSILGFSSFGFTFGAAVGPLLGGYIFDVTGTYQFAFLICALLSIAGLILTVFLKQAFTGSSNPGY